MFSWGSTLPAWVDIAVVGAGPQALTLVTHLLQKRPGLRQRVLVLDPSGQWLCQWRQQFARLEIPYLRSPIVHHPDPNPVALRTFAASRVQEMFTPYDRPGTQLFWDFCRAVIHRWQLQDSVYKAQVEAVVPLTAGGNTQFRLRLGDGRTLLARRVVLAMGGGMPQTPQWVSQVPLPYPRERLCHAHAVDLRTLSLAGETVLIVGSGLTSGHLAVGAIARGAQVIMMARRQFYDKLFDADPGWLGPKYLKQFQAEPSWEARLQIIQQARNGGSLTPEIRFQLRRHERQGTLQFYEHCQIKTATWTGQHWQLNCNVRSAHGCWQHRPIHRIWLATGSQVDLGEHPLLSEVRAACPTLMVAGLPVLDPHLRWPGCELFVMGRGAALRLGPVAGNLAGGRMACEWIVPALTQSGHALTPMLSRA